MKFESYKTTKSFYPRATKLRAHFEDQFKDPLHTHSGRFVWDFWNVPGQYSHLRTPAYHYFPKELYAPFHRHLVEWGRQNLGCHDVSPPWLSLYIDGCYQDWHADRPHGPWAFVYALTPQGTRHFKGGETWLRKTQTELVKLPSRFNELIVFDPSIVHRVSPVRGTREPMEGRLVIHGWFVQPRPFISGPISVRRLQTRVDAFIGEDLPRILRDISVSGMASFRLKISTSGEVSQVAMLAQNLRSQEVNSDWISASLVQIRAALLRWRFPKASSASEITLPLVFENEEN